MEDNIKLARLAMIAIPLANRCKEDLHTKELMWTEDPCGLDYSEVSLDLFTDVAEKFGFDSKVLQVEILRLPENFCLKPHFHRNSVGILIPIHPGEIWNHDSGVIIDSVDGARNPAEVRLQFWQLFPIPAGFVHGLRTGPYVVDGVFVLSFQSASTEGDTVYV